MPCELGAHKQDRAAAAVVEPSQVRGNQQTGRHLRLPRWRQQPAVLAPGNLGQDAVEVVTRGCRHAQTLTERPSGDRRLHVQRSGVGLPKQRSERKLSASAAVVNGAFHSLPSTVHHALHVRLGC
jgi:hypothetical protein